MNSSHSHHACPRCSCRAVRRSHRVGIVERVLFRLVFVRPYRCLKCDRRFFQFERAFPLAVPEQIAE